MDIPRFQSDLLAWYDVHQRDLPWRRSTDPYPVLVSEVMLQQTRVDVVAPRFEAWMERWPDVQALAAASVDDLVAEWSGLGYYQRARRLHAAAQHVAASGWPENLQDLPGVGPYVAGALGSIAFGQPVAAVDGNVERVVARVADVAENVRRAVGGNQIRAITESWVHQERPGDWTQALMELGATVCTPTNPKCEACPVAKHCTTEVPHERPVKSAKSRPVDERMHFAVVRRDNQVLLVKRPATGLLGGTWGLPGGPADGELEPLVHEQTGVHACLEPDAGEVTHVFSHRRWTMNVRTGTGDGEVASDGARWVHPDDFDRYGISTAMRKAMAAAPQAH